MGQFVVGNTLPVTGWRDWKRRLGPHLGGSPGRALGGLYAPATFPIPTITPKSFWSAGGYRSARFPVPLAGEFETTRVLEQPSKWGLQGPGMGGPVDDALAFVDRNKGLLLLAGVVLLGSGALKGRSRRR